ncbi:MAG: ATP synthase F0 subunit B [Desulfovibrio sp.]|jgi:F-type H+-transporting ATPase subunit b|nr:ATP synthase F0 subunit B [Desulfovibrio sp.]
MLDLNITLLIQLTNFFIAVFVLNLFLIRPIREIIKKRKCVIGDISDEAGNFEAKASSRLAGYEDELVKARNTAALVRNDSHAAGMAEQQNIVGQAQQSARNIIDEARRTVQAEAEVTLKDLRTRTAAISAGLADLLLKELGKS